MSRRRKRTINNEEKFSLPGLGSEPAGTLGSEALNSPGWCLQCPWLPEVCPRGRCEAFVVHMNGCGALGTWRGAHRERLVV